MLAAKSFVKSGKTMSLIGQTPITIPASVTVTINGQTVTVKGPKGELSMTAPVTATITQADNVIKVTRVDDSLQAKANHGLVRSLVNNMVIGVTDGYTKKLEMIGTGYRAKKQGTGLSVSAGYSHPIEVPAPAGISFDVENETIISVSGIDKQLVGETAAKLRAIRKPEPYKGKGIRYQGEVIRRKAGKAAKTAGA
jgi:large subunit ribosomal protein L6